MKYVNYRVDTQAMNMSGTALVSGWFVMGQRETDLNWSYLGEVESEEEAIEYAKEHRKAHGIHKNCCIYNPAGIAYMHNGQMA